MAGPLLAAFEIDTERLRLRPLQAGDEALFHALYTDPDTMRFIAPPLSAEQAARLFRKTVAGMQQQPFRWLSLAIVQNLSQQAFGICGVSDFAAGAKRLEVGILLTAEARSRGIALEALAALVQRMFDVLSVDEIWLQCCGEYPAIERLAIRVGMALDTQIAEQRDLSSKRIWSVCRASRLGQESING